MSEFACMNCHAVVNIPPTAAWPQSCPKCHSMAGWFTPPQTSISSGARLPSADYSLGFKHATDAADIEVNRLRAERDELDNQFRYASGALDGALLQLTEARAQLKAIRAVVDEQALDEGLWAIPIPPQRQPIVEAYLQQELRRLHQVIES